MPMHPGRPCRQLYCPRKAVDKSGYCEKHKPKGYLRQGTAPKQGGYDAAHRRIRLTAFSRDNGLCQLCLKAGRYTEATIAHHIQDVIGHPELKYNLDNIMSVCRPCHEEIHKRRRRD